MEKKRKLDAHLKEWQELSRRNKESILEFQASLQMHVQPIVEAHHSLQNAIKSIFTQQQEVWKQVTLIQFPRFDLSKLSPLTSPVAEFQGAIQQLVVPVFEELQRTFRELPPRTQEALLLLGNHGWYMDLEMSIPELWQLKGALEKGNVLEAEHALREYFENRLEKIEISISKRFPRRARLVRAAFNAHRKREYELSIPVLLAQTDGICKEVVNQYLFIKQNKKPSTAIYVEQIATDSYKAALLSPLARTLPISASQHERSSGTNVLNRHTVLHGDSLDYGTEINSLKAISLISYVAHVLKDSDEKN